MVKYLQLRRTVNRGRGIEKRLIRVNQKYSRHKTLLLKE